MLSLRIPCLRSLDLLYNIPGHLGFVFPVRYVASRGSDMWPEVGMH